MLEEQLERSKYNKWLNRRATTGPESAHHYDTKATGVSKLENNLQDKLERLGEQNNRWNGTRTSGMG